MERRQDHISISGFSSSSAGVEGGVFKSLSGSRNKRRKFDLLGYMNWESALWDFVWICFAPRRVYRKVYYHKQSTGQWSRDDPAFFLLIVCALVAVAVLHAIYFRLGFVGALKLSAWFIATDLFLVGGLVASFGYAIGNQFLMSKNHISHATSQSLEWLYCFDVHCNAIVPVIMFSHLVQLIFAPILVIQSHPIVGRILGNSLHLVSAFFYNYITFLGYAALPFLQNTVLILYPSVLVVGLYVTSLFSINISA
eukprot:Partr_v1_DN23868_c1_g1_i1_m63755 putative unc-50 homolog (C. elegans)